MKNPRHRLSRLSLIFAALCCLSASSLCAQSDVALGSSGELYRARTGAYQDLFPGQTPPQGVDPASSALALDIERAAANQRLLVPGTAGNDVELLPSLLFEDASDTVYLIWEKRVNNIHPVLMLTGFSNGGFSDPIEINSDSFADKTHPQIALTRDKYLTTGADGNPVTRSRTILHIVWAQDDSTSVDTFYSPIVFEEGVYIGWNPVYRLNDLDNSTPAALGYPLSPLLPHSPRLVMGQDGRTAIVAFAAPSSQNLLTVELDALPAALSQLADKARAQIIETGKPGSTNRKTLADKARAAIMTAGAQAFRPEVLQAIADAVWATIMGCPPQQTVQSIADKARAQIIETGANFSGRGLRTFGDDATATIAEVRSQSQDPGGDPSPYPSQLFQLRLTSSRPAPNVGTGTGETHLFASETGERTIASWLDSTGNRVLYRVSDDGTWSDPRELDLSSSLSLADAYAVLDQRVRSH